MSDENNQGNQQQNDKTTNTPPPQGDNGTQKQTQPGTQVEKGFWPDTWRERWSGDDPKKLQFSQRYASPEAMFDGFVNASNKIRSGEYKAALPKDANEQELIEWRKANGIPDAPDKYDLKFDNGLVIGEQDKPIVDGFLTTAHASNLTPDQAKNAVQWYYDEQKRMSDERAEKDQQQQQETMDKLNAEWGGEYRQNMNMVNGFLNAFPEDVRDLLKAGRLGDGTAIFNHPNVIKGFVELALQANPAAKVVPNSFGNERESVEEAIAKIEKTMRENRKEYNKDEKMQQRYRDLLIAKERLQSSK